MPARAWILRHGFHWVVNGRPKGVPDLPQGFQDFSHHVGQAVGYAPPLIDPLEWGPQHLDLAVQRQLRMCYARSTFFDDDRTMQACLRAWEAGDELIFWADPRLTSCLTGLWMLAWLRARAGSLDRVSLVIDPDPVQQENRTVEQFHQLFGQRVPAAGLAALLLPLRDHLASDSDQIAVDPRGLPETVGSWVGLGGHLADFLPDQRGLDLFDDRLLEHLTDDWQRAAWPVGNAMVFSPSYLGMPGNELWLRLVELSDQKGLWSLGSGGDRGPLCELRIHGPAEMQHAQVRITRLGRAVRSGRSDAFRHRDICRWVGGRLITNERVLRRPGSYRQQNHRGTVDPQSIPSSELDAG
jgi:hypothetical protein